MNPLDSLALLSIYALIGGIACCIAGAVILSRIDREFAGCLLGFFLGPLGLVIAWAMRENGIHEEEERRRHHQSIDATMRNFQIADARQHAAPAARVSAIEELERLAALRERGHITDDEFNRRKALILGGSAAEPHQRWR